MQDIDFSRYYRKGRRAYSVSEASEARKSGAPVNKLSLYLAIAFSSLAIGFIGGTQLQKHKMMRELENRVAPDSVQSTTVVTANVAAAEEEKAAETVRKSRSDEGTLATRADKGLEGSYLILAKIYPDEKEASLAGINLKRNGLKAFMARNGKKVKLYVGPIEGKSAAYEILAQVKKNPEFSGAILYRK